MGAGYTVANGRYGAQRRLRKEFAVRERHVSDEAKAWAGYYYGLNALAPDFEVILLAQRPISAGDEDHRPRAGARNRPCSTSVP